MAWAPLIGTTDTPSALRSRPNRRAASVKASSSVTPSTKTIVRTAQILSDGTRITLALETHAHQGDLLLGAFLDGRLARPCLLRRRFWMEALRKHLLACRAVPLLVLVVGDLALDKELCELSALRLALERH